MEQENPNRPNRKVQVDADKKTVEKTTIEANQFSERKYMASSYNQRLATLREELQEVMQRALKRSPLLKRHPVVSKIDFMITNCDSASLLYSQVKELTNDLPISLINRLIGNGNLVDLNYAIRAVLQRHQINELMASDTDAIQKATDVSNRTNREIIDELRASIAANKNILGFKEEELRQTRVDLDKAEKDVLKLVKANDDLKANEGQSTVQSRYITDNEKLTTENRQLSEQLKVKTEEVRLLKTQNEELIKQNEDLKSLVNTLQTDLNNLKDIFPFENRKEYEIHENKMKDEWKSNITNEMNSKFQEILNNKDTSLETVTTQLRQQQKDLEEVQNLVKTLVNEKKTKNVQKQTPVESISKTGSLYSLYNSSPSSSARSSVDASSMFSLSFGGRK